MYVIYFMWFLNIIYREYGNSGFRNSEQNLRYNEIASENDEQQIHSQRYWSNLYV